MNEVLHDMIRRLGHPSLSKNSIVPHYYYNYSFVSKVITLNKGDDNPLKILGTFVKVEAAREACLQHHKKSCRIANIAGRSEPKISILF